MNFTEEEKEFFMKEALKEAQKAAENEEVPIGVVIVKDGEIIARDFNRTNFSMMCRPTIKLSPIEIT
ncbi:deaminase, partial [Lactococcus lactis]